MRDILTFNLDPITPNRTEVLQAQGMKPNIVPSQRIQFLYNDALRLFKAMAEPTAVLSGISIAEFSHVLMGNGKNEADIPIQKVFPRADQLALFAFTLGHKISSKIGSLFTENEYAMGAMVDAMASCSAERAVQVSQDKYHQFLLRKQAGMEEKTVLLYSPGYCGWHVSGQKPLFDYLKPEVIGISLNDSYLMIPLKSVSGILIAGDIEIHQIQNNYPFCTLCQDKTCQKRIKQINKARRNGGSKWRN